MQNSFFKRLVASVIASITGLALIVQPLAAVAYTESDAWYDFSANFNQAAQATTPGYNGGQNSYGNVTITGLAATVINSNNGVSPSVLVNFTLNGAATYLSVTAQNNQTGVQTTIATESQPSSGYRSFNWGSFGIQSGMYTVNVQVTSINGQSSFASTSVSVTANGNGGSNNPSVPVNNTYIINKAVTALPTTFGAGQSTTVTYDVNTLVLATIDVRSSAASSTSTPVKSFQQTVGAGTYSWTWNGTDNNGQYVASGDYNISVKLMNSYDAVSTPIKVTFTGGTVSNPNPYPNPCAFPYNCPVSGTVILNASAAPSNYNPLSGQLQVSYYILGQANVTVTIIDIYGAVVKTIKPGNFESGTNVAFWNGVTSFGSYAGNGTYRFRVVATANGQTDAKEGTFTIGGTLDPLSYCGGFKDVKVTSFYCNAIIEMQKQGVFVGYSNNIFRPYEPINRAETVKVVMKALKYNVPETGWYFDSAGFKDVFSGAWYTPYLAAARLYGVIEGYSDKTFRPGNTVNRAELSKIFLEASNISQLAIPCEDKPYNEITKTKWYGKYACTVKYFSLIEAIDGKFAAGTPMTRGDVALMIYRAQQQGLMKTLPPKPQINFYAIQQYQFPYKAF